MLQEFVEGIQSLFNWAMGWDQTALILNVVASFIFLFLLQFFGVFQRCWIACRHFWGVQKYRKSLREECETLIIIGENKGLSLSDVFVPLDLARSSLSAVDGPATRSGQVPRSSCVLLGGPGAGKSTLVKHWVVTVLNSSRRLVFMVRLRDYTGAEKLEDYIADRLSRSGVPNALALVNTELVEGNCFCVLDGLDEVRPQQRDNVVGQINAFYSRYFKHVEGDMRRPTARRCLVVSCRKEAYRDIPLDIQQIWDVRPLNDEQIKEFVTKWPRPFPRLKSKETFLRDLHATTQVLELARSPLLLVGGLTQYTETNLGIPEQRFEYLQRVARWLIVEWATAQGHPADPNRPAYDRILPKLAFHMHLTERAEIPLAEAKSVVASWLPEIGLQPTDADRIIGAIAEKTGILQRDTEGIVVFAQFGLHEYFASLEGMPRLGVAGISERAANPWWREVILLCAAQQREPGSLLEALFGVSPLLAVAALSECPTPPLDLQQRAVAESIALIEREDTAVSGAVVPLLRKVKGAVEARLSEELEKRLAAGGAVAALVASILATAGTDASTDVLSRHPEVWDETLGQTSSLSASFEKLLVRWIDEGNDSQSEKAAVLLVGRLSASLLRQLLDLLPRLSPRRAEFLAVLLIERAANARHDDEMYSDDLKIFSECAPFIVDADLYFSRVALQKGEMEARVTALREMYSPSFIPIRRLFWDSWGRELGVLAGAGPTALFLHQQRNRAGYIHRTLSKAWLFPQCVGSLACTLAVAQILLMPALDGPTRLNALAMGFGLFVVGFGFLVVPPPWRERMSSETIKPLSAVVLLVVGGMSAGLFLLSFGWAPQLDGQRDAIYANVFTSGLAAAMAIGAALAREDRDAWRPRRRLLGGVNPMISFFIRFVETGWAAFVAALVVAIAFAGIQFWGWQLSFSRVSPWLGVALLVATLAVFVALALSWRAATKASGQAAARIESLLDLETSQSESVMARVSET